MLLQVRAATPGECGALPPTLPLVHLRHALAANLLVSVPPLLYTLLVVCSLASGCTGSPPLNDVHPQVLSPPATQARALVKNIDTIDVRASRPV